VAGRCRGHSEITGEPRTMFTGVGPLPSFRGYGLLRPELPAIPTMLATEHARAAPNRAGWRLAVVVLRYFVAVRRRHLSGAIGSARTRGTANVGVSGLVVAQHH
jgi:hypothetical protein